MMNYCRRFVVKRFPARQNPATELCVFTADIAFRPRAQVGSEATILLKQFFLKGHVGSKWRFFQAASLHSQVKQSERSQRVSTHFAFPGQQNRRDKPLF